MKYLRWLLLLIPISGFSQKTNVLDGFFTALAQNQQFSGNVLIIDQDKIIYEKSFGFSDYTTKEPISSKISFPIASISKLFTATAILQLKEQGLLEINDTAKKYLTDFPYPEITIRHLLSHTSGLPPYNVFFDHLKKENPDKVFYNNDFIKGVVEYKKPLIYQPGEKGNYDNINYLVLALIIEKVSGMPYQDYIKKNILLPAGMTQTQFFPLPEQYNTSEIKNFAYPYLYPYLYSETPIKSSSIPYVKEYWHSYGFNGFGDYVSTTRDLWKFDRALSHNTLLTPQTLQEAFTPAKLNNGENNPDGFGLGWEIEKDTSQGKTVYHSGAATGLSCIILRNISKNQTVILFDNAHTNAHDNATKAMFLLNGKNVEHPKKSIAKIYGSVLLKQGPKAANDTLQAMRKDTENYYLSENEINLLGYDFMGNSNPYHLPQKLYIQQALETFKTNMELFPNSWNVYDSYGEALLKNGQKEEAIKQYQKSVELNPGNEAGKKILQEILTRN